MDREEAHVIKVCAVGFKSPGCPITNPAQPLLLPLCSACSHFNTQAAKQTAKLFLFHPQQAAAGGGRL